MKNFVKYLDVFLGISFPTSPSFHLFDFEIKRFDRFKSTNSSNCRRQTVFPAWPPKVPPLVRVHEKVVVINATTNPNYPSLSEPQDNWYVFDALTNFYPELTLHSNLNIMFQKYVGVTIFCSHEL